MWNLFAICLTIVPKRSQGLSSWPCRLQSFIQSESNIMFCIGLAAALPIVSAHHSAHCHPTNSKLWSISSLFKIFTKYSCVPTKIRLGREWQKLERVNCVPIHSLAIMYNDLNPDDFDFLFWISLPHVSSHKESVAVSRHPLQSVYCSVLSSAALRRKCYAAGKL